MNKFTFSHFSFEAILKHINQGSELSGCVFDKRKLAKNVNTLNATIILCNKIVFKLFKRE